jgi:hypothetical protein
MQNNVKAHTVWSLLCLGEWLKSNVMTVNSIVNAVAGIPDLKGDTELEMEEGWDCIPK